LSRVWLPKGERSMVKAQHIRQYTYVYSAIEPKTGESVSLIMPISNTLVNRLIGMRLSRWPLLK
jgi:hypothetical protein